MKSLYLKFVIITISIMIVSGITSFLLSNAYYQVKLKPYNDQKNTNIALDIATFVGENPNTNLNAYLESIGNIGYHLYLINPNGQNKFFGSPFRDETLSDETIEQVLNGQIFHGMLHFSEGTFVTGFFANELTNTIGVPLTHNEQKYALFLRPDIELLFNEMRKLFAWMLLFAILLSIIMVVLSTKYLIKPITKLTKATKTLSNGEFDVTLDIKRHDELGELSQSFLDMVKKLEQTEDIRKEFISNVSHDIQSPLSNIKGYTNLLADETLSTEEKEKYISIINGEIQRLSTLTRQLLLLASLDRNEDIVKKEVFRLDIQLKELIKSYQWLIGEKGMMLGYSLSPTEIYGDPSLLYAVWDNLLTNAIKYNCAHGSIDITIEQKEKTVCILVKDTGIGLSETNAKRIFDRFYRVDTSRTRTIEGTGLGLSIVASIVKLHHGDLRVESDENQGSTFIVELPTQ
ncbi:Heme sensor protein HssS [Paraliobacillus sp. PM-2]|uniref:sensor histidine kinase n=1 Tax=Paraliobacillus sp. PM-2 TaxID=1462524 RepID=UPI00061BF437|nr:HAMP domain-containing sensor histidine kinase [Paraliobacillus sp. PM-2]CQR45959.1 Heme sensor protein HssS [Paraliobacillus sp. PM-2]